MHLASLLTCAVGLFAVALADLPFNCHLEAFDAWTPPKREWCCDRQRPGGWLPPACPSDGGAPARQAQDGDDDAWPPPPAGASLAPAAPRAQLDTGAIKDADSKPVHIPDGDSKLDHTAANIFAPPPRTTAQMPHVLGRAPQAAAGDAEHHGIGGVVPGGDPLWITVALVVAVLLAGALLAWVTVKIRREAMMGRSTVPLPHERGWYAWTPFSDDTKRVAVF